MDLKKKLFESNSDHMVDLDDHDHTEKFIRSTKILEKSNKTLERATQILSETEQIGIDAVFALKGQRERMKNTHNELYNIDYETRQGSQIIRNMSKREIIIKIIIIVAILLLLLIICVILFFVFYPLFNKSA